MAKKVSENDIQDMTQDWGLDTSNNLPYSGAAVQKFIKETFGSKMGYFHYDASSNRYLCFADEASKDKYVANPTMTELVLGAFDAPFNYEASITLLSDSYVPVLLGTKGNYITFDFDIKNKSGNSVGESVNATWTFIKGNTKQTLKAKYRYGQTVSLNVDKYLSEGTNTVIISIVGESTLAATSASVTYQVVNLQLSSSYDISQSYNLQANPSAVAEIPFTVSGYGTKIVEWYLDGVQIAKEASIDEVTGTSASRTKIISLANLSQGHHSVQMRAYTVIDGETFHSDTLYRDVMVYTGVNTNPIIALSASLPASMGIVKGDLTLEGATQYIPYIIGFAVYNPMGAAVDVTVAVDGKTQATVTAESGVVNSFSYVATAPGSKTITFTAGATVRGASLLVEESENTLEEITDALELDLQAVGKTNRSADRDQWAYGRYSTVFNGFQWNALSGWNDGALVMGEGNSIDVSIAPLASDATTTGKTMEFEFSTTGVSNDDAIVCDLRDSSGTGILITASKVSLISSGGKVLSSPFKSGENIRVGFVINKDAGVTNKGLAFIYINGIASGAVNFAETDNFMSSATLHIAGSDEAGVALRSLRFYNAALTDEQMLNNYILYRRSVDEMMAVYDRNDIYEEGTENFSMDKLANQLPVMIITGDIPALEETTDKNKSIVVDVEYINYQNPELSFTMKNAHMQPQGTSSMGYPKKNFRLYTQKRDDTKVFDHEGKEIESRLYSFKEGAIPVNCWCMKADYAESSSTHNTAIARLWNDVMKNMKVDDEYVCRTHAQQAAIDNGYQYDVRTTVDGFPIIMAYRLTSTSDLVFIGKYNFNNDKETENVFGFKDIPGFDNSRMQCWEVLNNGNHLALFQDTANFDTEWKDAFESRYPDTKTPDTADLKAFATWLTTTGNFASEKWQHLDVYKMAAYYVYVMRFGAVDQTVKNAMFTSEDGQKFYYINYDNDTINGLRNDGYLMYPPTITRQSLDESYDTEVYAYAGHDSRLWNYLEADTEFMQIVQVVDSALYNVGLTYANVIKMFDEQQSAKWCERVYNRDAQYKYVGPFVESGTNNLFMMQGSRQSHRRWWLSKRFAFIDSLFVSGEYKANIVEAKLANAPIGLEFGIKAGIAGNYGYGVNNVAISYGVPLEKGGEHTFTTAQVLNVGDPLRIYAAPNLEGVDLSNFIQYMSTLNIGGVYTDTLGTQLKTLKLGVDYTSDARRNTSLSEISGLGNAKKLETLDIEGFEAMTSLDLGGLNYLKSLHAYASGLTSISLPDGSPIELLELPTSIQGIVLSNANSLTAANLKLQGGWNNVSTISIKRCPSLVTDWSLIKNWKDVKTTEDAKCSLTMEGIDWSDVQAEDIIALGGIKTAGGVLSLKGTIRMAAVDTTQIAAIKSIYGEHVFVKGGELWFTAPDGVFITGASEVVEGDSVQLYGDIVSENPGTLTWEITSGSGATISQDGLLTTTETGSARTVTLRIKHVPTVGAVVYNTKDIAVKKAVRPTAGTVSGADAFNSEAEYTLALSPSGINRNYSVVWSLSGTAASGVSIKSSDKDSCVVTASAGAAGSLTVTATITTDKGVKVTASKTALVGATLKMNILSNQGTDSTIAAVKANITYAGTTVTGKHGDTVAVPANTLITVTFPAVDGYVTPESLEFVTGDKEDEVRVTYYTTVLTVTIADNQSAYNDISGAKATVSAAGMTTKTLSSGGTAKVPTGAECTITWSSVTDYKTPATVKFTAEGTSVSKTGTYQTEVVTVSVVCDDAEQSVTGATFTFNGTNYTWNGTAVVKKIAFGTTYTITAGEFGDLIPPAAASFVAEQASRSVVLTYSTVKPDGVDLSLVDIHGAALARHNTANCYVVKEAGWYSFPLVYGNAITNGVANTAAYTKVAGTYSHDFVNYNDVAITSPFVEEDTGVTAAGVELSLCDESGLISQLHLQDRQLCRYIGFKLNKVPTTGANAVVSVLDGSGVVMWSWHIWVWPDDLTPVTITNATSVNYNILPVNLATKKSSTTAGRMYNLFYQWGRPTPMLHNSMTNVGNYGEKTFAVSSSNSDTYGESIKNPHIFYGNSDNPKLNWFGTGSYYNLWDASSISTENSDSNVVKTVYDPCPPGFKIPNGNTFTYFSTSNTIGSFNYGRYFKRNANDTTGVFFPASGTMLDSNGSVVNVDVNGAVWLSSSASEFRVYTLKFTKTSVNPNDKNFSRASGVSVRPVQDGTPLQYAETTIRLDQTISDPATMITRTVDGGAIEAIRAHSHRYTGSLNSDGVMVLKQLDDNNGNVYLDGSAADLTTLGTDVWMKLPQFYYKAVEASTDVWDITFRFGAAPSGSGWKEWDGKDLIGVYEAYSDGTMLYSVSGKASKSTSQPNFVTYAHARGNGFTLVRWKHHSIMAFLFYALYGNTNSQAIIGTGTKNDSKATGQTNEICMIDTDAATNGNSQSINFWGLENWWGNKYEWLEGVLGTINEILYITEDNGTQRTLPLLLDKYGFTSKIAVGEHLDALCSEASGSATTGFCDYYYVNNFNNENGILRSGLKNNTDGGVSSIELIGKDASHGSRLAFRGEYVIE